MLVETPALLIADDDDDFRETLREVFAPRGFRTLLASDGDEALQIVLGEPVHLLLVDMHMPRLTGLELARRVRESQVAIPWILLSAALDAEIVREAQAAAAFSVLAKPVRFKQITEVVADAMRARYNWVS
ncbi:MAG: response regulator [Pirellulales bacterium]